MHKKTFILFLSLAFVAISNAQRYAVIDSKYILEKLADYKTSQTKLDLVSVQWQLEIEKKQIELDKMYKDYDAEQVMLSNELKKKREDELFNREKEVRDLQKKRFGFEGDLFKIRQELIKPIQDRVYVAIQKLAIERSYDFILDNIDNLEDIIKVTHKQTKHIYDNKIVEYNFLSFNNIENYVPYINIYDERWSLRLRKDRYWTCGQGLNCPSES